MRTLYRSAQIISVILLLLINAYSQVPDWSWAKSVTCVRTVFPNEMSVDSFGWIYITGGFQSNTVDFGSTTLSGGNSNVNNPYLVKYNSKGEVVWAVNPDPYGSSTAGSLSYGVTVDNIGNSYIGGFWSELGLVFETDTLWQTGSSNDGFIAKYDAGGNYQWALSIYSSSVERVFDVILDKEGYLYATGRFYGDSAMIDYIHNGQEQTYTLYNSGSNKDDVFLIKYTADGDLVWANNYGNSSSSEYPNYISVDAYNNILVAGYFGGTTTLGSFSLTSKGSNDGFVMKLDENGSVSWAIQVGTTGADDLIAVEAEENIYITGTVKGNLTLGSYSFTNMGGADIYLAKLDSAGNIIWVNYYAGTDDDLAYGLELDNNENILITASYNDASIIMETDTLPNEGSRDVLFFKVDSAGNDKWYFHTGGSLYDVGYAVVADKNDNLYLAGGYYSSSITFGSDTLTDTDSYFNLFLAALVDFSDTVSVYDTTKIYKFDNGGLYGGTSADLTYSQNNRLFSGIETPASLFVSDDGATSWYQAFDNDSLEYSYNGSLRGWSGKATRILSNQNAWVAVQTNHPKNKYSSIVISYNNGDTNTWKTAIDPVMLSNFGYGSYAASAIGLSDYYLYAALGPCIIKIDTGNINSTTDIVNITSAIGSLPSTSTINSIAVANNSIGYPYYLAIDQSGNANGYNRLLYKYDGANYTQLTVPSDLNGIRSVFTHPAQISGDTIFISGMDKNTNAYKVYRSFDGGINWTDISYTGATDFLSDVDYSADWVSQLTSSNGIILIIPGNAISKDLGGSWDVMGNSQTANAIKPDDLNTVVGSAKTVEISTTGVVGNFSRTPNNGLESLKVNKIARAELETVFYIATQTGLGYTTAYLDTSLSSGEKWTNPYGEFPLISDTINFGAVAIDPDDSLHVIAGCSYGFYVSSTGPTGFSLKAPSGFMANNPQVKDIEFVNSGLALAVTGGDSSYHAGLGNIWRTADGGLSWDSVSPIDFSSGNTIAIGITGSDTIIYVGSGLLDVDDGYLWKSYDMGISWQKIKKGPTSMAGTSVQGLPINDIAIDPRGNDTLYIAAGYDDEYAFVLSFDGGNNYIYLNSYAEKPYTSIAINLEYPDTVYTASGREIYLYDLANNNFRFVFRGLPDEQIPALMTGSILVGTTTGFYTFDPNLETDEEDSIPTLIPNLSNELLVEIYPNPFTDETTIAVSLKESASVSIALYDIVGNKIKDVFMGNCLGGKSVYSLSSANLSVGIYYLKIKANDMTSSYLVGFLK